VRFWRPKIVEIEECGLRAGWSRLIAAVAVVAATALASGCVVFQGAPAASQLQTVGDLQQSFTVCASNNTVPGGCNDGGLSGLPVLTGTGQVLLGVRLQNAVTPPTSFTSAGPEALAFTQSPTYAAELQRLAPAPAGTRWVGYISAVTNYSGTSGQQNFPVLIAYKLGQGADGSPFQGPVATEVRGGGRQVTAAFPGTRPVVCGPGAPPLFDEDPSTTTAVFVVCVDAVPATSTATRDLGVLGGNATASGGPGSLASLPFTLRYAGTATASANFTLSATSTLPNASLAVTPGALAPAANSDTQALVAVGIPAGARAGTYDVTLTAKLANGQTRTRTGKLTVTGAGGGGGGTTGGGTVKLKLTTVLPRGLSVVTARKSGIAVLIGATKTGNARVQLFQGTGRKGKKPKATKNVRLRVPGPTRVVLKGAKLKTGAYRVVITAGGRTFVRRAALTR
jgi:hypothetical protein